MTGRRDILGPPYTAETLELPDDDEGTVVATLVRRPAGRRTRRAVLHVHGFADYFFQTAYAAWWTERGYDFRSVIVAMYAWGNKHFTPEGASVVLVNERTGAAADPLMVDRTTGRPLLDPAYKFAPGPAARETTRAKLAASPWGTTSGRTVRPTKQAARKSGARS